MASQEDRIEKEILEAEQKEIELFAKKIGSDTNALEQILQPIIDSCTKDSIAVSSVRSKRRSAVINTY